MQCHDKASGFGFMLVSSLPVRQNKDVELEHMTAVRRSRGICKSWLKQGRSSRVAQRGS